MKIRNIFIIFIVSCLWHGANWTFIIWGALNALYFLPLLILNKNRNNLEIVAKGKIFPSLKEVQSIILTFGLTVFAWIFFRAKDVSHALKYISGIFSRSIFQKPHFENMMNALITSFIILIFLMIEWRGREQQYAFYDLGSKWKKPLRWAMYYLLVITIFYFSGKEQKFIYFQF